MLTVTEVRQVEQLAPLGARWAELLAATPQATFFQSLEWLVTYWRHFGTTQQLRALLVERDGQLVGIVPLAVRRQATRVGRVRVLGYPIDDWGTLFGPIGPDARAVLEAAFEHLSRSPRDWDLLDLRWIDRDGSDAGATRAALAASGLQAIEQPLAQVAVVDLERVARDGYWRTRRSKLRENLRAEERKLGRWGRVEYVRQRGATISGDGAGALGAVDAFEACQCVARGSWQAQSRSGNTLCHREVSAFLRDAHLAAVAAGTADANLLFVGGRPVAFAYNYCQTGHVSGLRMGRLAEPAASGAGNVLLARMLDDSFARGDRLFDLGADYLAGKRLWLSRTITTYRYTHYTRGAKAQMLLLKQRARSWYQVLRGPVNTSPGTTKS